MALEGDFSTINSVIATLEGVARDALPRIASQAVPKIAAIIDEQFATETDPYGAGWQAHAPATVERWGEHPIMTLTGDMHSTASVTASGASIHVEIGGPANIHQDGWENGPARALVPDNGSIPASYEDALIEAAREVLG